MTAPLFSVVIPAYNRVAFLREALASVFAQEHRNYEVIVVDDGSTEDLSPCLEGYQDRVRLVRQENAGPGAARNRGAALARGEYLAFLDSDDLWFPWTLSAHADVLEREHSAVVLGCGGWFQNVSELKRLDRASLEYGAFADFLAAHRSVLWVGSGGLTVRRSTFQKLGGFRTDLRIAEDLDLFLRMGTEPGFVVITAPATFGYRQHATNSINNLDETLRGAFHLLAQEKSGGYPGGRARAPERLQLLTRFLRPPSLAALMKRRFGDAWKIYTRSFAWHLRQARLKYLIGFWIRAAASVLVPPRQPSR